MTADYDCIVLGAGPAGCATALGLAALGHRVVVVSRQAQVAAVEGLSARTEEALRAAGLGDALEALGPPVERRVWWNGAFSAVNRERIVDRTRFNAKLLDIVAGAGLPVVTATAGCLGRDGARRTVTLWPSRRRRVTLKAPILVDTRGRAAPRLGGRRLAAAPTVALVRAWRLPRGTGSQSAVASFNDGWAWFAATDDRHAVLQFFISGGRGEAPPRAGLEARYEALVAALPQAGEWLAGARPAGKVVARTAGPVLSEPVLSDGVIRVGDAAVALDPLSGHGVFEALSCARAAIPTVNSLLRDPDGAEAAKAFYRHRAGTRFLHAVEVGAAFYGTEQRWAGRPFWRRRRDPGNFVPAFFDAPPAVPSIARRPVVDGDVIAMAEVIATPHIPRGVWRVAGVPLAPLLRFLTAAEGTSEAAARHFAAAPGDIATARDWLRHYGLIGRAA